MSGDEESLLNKYLDVESMDVDVDVDAFKPEKPTSDIIEEARLLNHYNAQEIDQLVKRIAAFDPKAPPYSPAGGAAPKKQTAQFVLQIAKEHRSQLDAMVALADAFEREPFTAAFADLSII